jgi:MoaA/NifB/PqqE/SkfB family radical SAM enzyme
LLFNGLVESIAHAKSLGTVTTVTTNGTIADAEMIYELKTHLDLIAISLDGPPLVHNEIRGSKYAFELCKRVFDEISVPTELPFFNWYELLVKRSHEMIELTEGK